MHNKETKYIFALAIETQTIFLKIKNILRGGAVVARWAHNPKVVSSNLAPATRNTKESRFLGIGFFLLGKT